MKGFAHANRLSGVDFSSKYPPLFLANDGFNHDRCTRAILVFERPAGSLRVAKCCGTQLFMLMVEAEEFYRVARCHLVALFLRHVFHLRVQHFE